MQSLGVQDVQSNMQRHFHPRCSSDVPRYAQASTNGQQTQYPSFTLLNTLQQTKEPPAALLTGLELIGEAGMQLPYIP